MMERIKALDGNLLVQFPSSKRHPTYIGSFRLESHERLTLFTSLLTRSFEIQRSLKFLTFPSTDTSTRGYLRYSYVMQRLRIKESTLERKEKKSLDKVLVIYIIVLVEKNCEVQLGQRFFFPLSNKKIRAKRCGGIKKDFDDRSR